MKRPFRTASHAVILSLCLFFISIALAQQSDQGRKVRTIEGVPESVGSQVPAPPVPDLHPSLEPTPSIQADERVVDPGFEDQVRQAIDTGRWAKKMPTDAGLDNAAPPASPPTGPKPYTPPQKGGAISTRPPDPPKTESEKPAARPRRDDARTLSDPGTDGPVIAVVLRDVNLRAGPATDYEPVGVVKAGTEVEVRSCLGWCEVRAQGYGGWVYRSFLDLPPGAVDVPRR